MSKVAVVYWSGTGNTEMMANEVAAGAKAAGAEVSVFTPVSYTHLDVYKRQIQDVQFNRPQTRALHALSLHSQLLSEVNGRSAHSKMKIHPIANKFA